METCRFLELQYLTLRKEIEDANLRAFNLMLGGVTAIPAVQYIAKTYDLNAIALGLPILVLVIALLYLAQNLTIMRAGRYIREIIEPVVKDFTGWETWLEEGGKSKDRRLYDKMAGYSFYLLFLLYYCFSVYLAKAAADFVFGNTTTGWFFVIAYGVVGFGIAVFIFWNLRILVWKQKPESKQPNQN